MNREGGIIAVIIRKYAKPFIKCEFGLDIFSEFQCHCPVFQKFNTIFSILFRAHISGKLSLWEKI